MQRSLPRIPPDRDLSIDAVRALCLPIVVLLHALQMGIGGDPLRASNALDGWQPLAWATWVLMIMPAFFIAGGFAGLVTWRRLRRGGRPSAITCAPARCGSHGRSRPRWLPCSSC